MLICLSKYLTGSNPNPNSNPVRFGRTDLPLPATISNEKCIEKTIIAIWLSEVNR